MADSTPKWLRIMENGSIGEARTKAFLIDRFWVLERSVDIDGADFLIQLRDQGQRFTDRIPPRVGVVQAKYYGSTSTTHHIPQSYVLDDEGKPLAGFFALLHAGAEDKATRHLLSAADIHAHLELGSGDHQGKYVVGRKAFDDRFKITEARIALDRIEHSLKSQTPRQTVVMLDELHIPYRALDAADIEYEWTLPVPNGQTDIPSDFVEQKRKLVQLTYEIEDVLRALDAIILSRDPKDALAQLDEFERNYVGGHGLTFSFDPHDWQYLRDGVVEHDRFVDGLKRDHRLGAFMELRKAVDSALVDLTILGKPTGDQPIVVLELDYNPDDLTVVKVSATTCQTRPADIDTTGRVLVAREVRAPRRLMVKDLHNIATWVMRRVIERRYPDPWLDDARSP